MYQLKLYSKLHSPTIYQLVGTNYLPNVRLNASRLDHVVSANGFVVSAILALLFRDGSCLLMSINYYDMNLGRSREIHFSSQEKEEGALDILCVRGYPLP